MTPTSNLRANTWAVLHIAYDNAGTNGADPFNSIVDSLGNTWNLVKNALNDPDVANAGVVLREYYSAMNIATLTTSDTITVDFGATSVAAKAWILTELLPRSGKTMTYADYYEGQNTNGQAPTIPGGLAWVHGPPAFVFFTTGFEGQQSYITHSTDRTYQYQPDAGSGGTTTSAVALMIDAFVSSAGSTPNYNIALNNLLSVASDYITTQTGYVDV
jgi:hypothetical protein